MEFTVKDLIDKLNLTHVALVKSLKNIHFELKVVEGSTKPVKHYLYFDLPQRYKDKLIELGVVKEEKKDDSKLTNISKANFTNIYLMAGPIKQEIALARCKLIKFYLMRKLNTNRMTWLKETLKNNIEFDCLGDVTQRQLDTWLKKYKEAEASGSNLVEIL